MLPISEHLAYGLPPGRCVDDQRRRECAHQERRKVRRVADAGAEQDRKSTRLNSSHGYISYAVFCLKKKKLITAQLSLVVIAISSTTNLTFTEIHELQLHVGFGAY